VIEVSDVHEVKAPTGCNILARGEAERNPGMRMGSIVVFGDFFPEARCGGIAKKVTNPD